MPDRTTTDARSAATVARLVDVATDLFARQAYAATGTEELVRTAGVTRGALYHHFTDKKDLFRTVLDRIQAEVALEVQSAVEQHSDPWQQLAAGCHAFLAAATDPDRQQIMLIDGPAVLGWAEWRAIDARHSLRALTEGLTELVDLGIIQAHPIEPLAFALSGAMNETALWVAGTRHREQALRDATSVIDSLLVALRPRPEAADRTVL